MPEPTKFTRGPWDRGIDDEPTVRASGLTIATVYGPLDLPCYEPKSDEEVDRGIAEAEANAALIAAAPDLYRALEFFVYAIGERRPGWETISDTMLSTPEGTALDDALKALSKARGV